MKALYFDCFSGASGDMTVGALLDLGVDFAGLEAALNSLRVDGYRIRAEKAAKKGVMATQFSVDIDPGVKQPHRHLRHVVEIIQSGALPDAVKAAAVRTFERIAECEAQVHGTTVEKVHFHEVGAVDSIVDIVGAHFALHELGVDRIYASPLHIGSGTVTCAHGVMPVPAPATALLLKDIPSYATDVAGELVTPTGAALMGQIVSEFRPMPNMTIERVGYGSGTKDLPDRANVLRAIIGELSQPAVDTETIAVIETNIDDMNPELLPVLIESLLAEGARDAFLTATVGKKGRPGHQLTILCDEDKVRDIVAAVFANSTTIGLRIRTERRVCLEREWETVATPYGHVRIKIAKFEGVQTNAAPEFEDCRACAETNGVTVRAVYEAALAVAAKNDTEYTGQTRNVTHNQTEGR